MEGINFRNSFVDINLPHAPLICTHAFVACKNDPLYTAHDQVTTTDRYNTLTHTEQLQQVLESGVSTELLSEQPHGGVMEVVEGSYAA